MVLTAILLLTSDESGPCPQGLLPGKECWKNTDRFKVLVKQTMPGALDVVQFDIMVLLQQISRAGDIGVGKSLNRDVCNGPEI